MNSKCMPNALQMHSKFKANA
jgi:hypothetical protein